METKKCSHCRKHLPYECFLPDRKTCKTCLASAARKRAANPEKTRKRVRNPEKERKRKAEWAKNNAEKIRKRLAEWVKNNPEKRRENSRASRKRCFAANPDKWRAAQRSRDTQLRNRLAPCYVRNELARSVGVSASEIPDQLVALQTEILRIKRAVKEQTK